MSTLNLDPLAQADLSEGDEASALVVDQVRLALSPEPVPGSPAVQREFTPPARQKRRTKPRPPDVSDMTDEGHAGRFVDQYAGTLRYCPAWGAWFVYDGMRWGKDDTLAAERSARESVQSLRGYLPRIKAKDRTEFEDAIRRAESHRTIKAILGLARSDKRIVIRPQDFDQDPLVLNCRNGTVDLTTGRLCPHDPSDNLRKLAPVDYVTGTPCPVWDAFLRRIMGEDDDLVSYLQRAAGYALTGDVSGQCFFLLYGDGRNGKTVLLNALLHVLGDYGMTAPNNLLTSASVNQHPTGLADLDGKRFVAISEPNRGRFDDSLVKLLTGGDKIRARRMHCDPYEFAPSHKFFMAANHKPEVGESGLAMWRRIRLIPFSVTIPPHEEDRRLSEKLQVEAQGILDWLVRGCLEWRLKGLDEPERVRDATTEYREEMDPIAEFITDRCVNGPEHKVRTSVLHRAYEAWCAQAHGDSSGRMTIKDFAHHLEQKGFKSKKTVGVMTRIGISLKMPSEAEMPVWTPP